MPFRRLIMADWSAASSPGPKRPAANRCWVGCLDLAAPQPDIVYCRTRQLALEQIEAWTADGIGKGPVLIGFDFPFGYPAGSGLPGGRVLAKFLTRHVTDSDADRNNRFEAAANLNRLLNPGGQGPFWGCPRTVAIPGLAPTRPIPWPAHIPELRQAEHRLKGTGIQTVWKLAYPASVGSQVLMGMHAIHRLLEKPAFRDARIWPFETDWANALGAVTIAEIWPNLFFPALRSDRLVAPYSIRDAGQVAATLLAIRTDLQAGRIATLLGPPASLDPNALTTAIAQEGWIVGA